MKNENVMTLESLINRLKAQGIPEEKFMKMDLAVNTIDSDGRYFHVMIRDSWPSVNRKNPEWPGCITFDLSLPADKFHKAKEKNNG